MQPDSIIAAKAATYPKKGRSRLVAWLAIISGISAGVLALLLLYPLTRKTKEPAPNTPTSIGNFSLIERTGQSITEKDLLGKVWIAGFVFTRCHETCPMVSGVMARLRSELTADIKMVSISVDPRYDGPAVLRTYAESFKADPKSWWFLTGEKDEIYRLVRDGFRLPVMENAEAKDPSDRVVHSTRLGLVNKKGELVSLYESSDSASMDLLKRRALGLLKESP